MKYNKLIFKLFFTLLFLLLSFYCEKSKTPIGPSNEYGNLEYEITAGEAGIFHETHINEKGFVYFTHFIYSNGEYKISTSLTRQKHDSIIYILSENDFWNLSDKYFPDSPFVDGLYFSISYQTEDKSKKVIVEAGADIPIQLKNIYRTLEETNQFILSNPDQATLIIPWNRQHTIKKWPFSDFVKLEKKSYNYEEIICATEILDYFANIRNETGYDVLYWDADFLYEIYDGGENTGYFNAHQRYPIKYYNQEFDYDITELQNDGIIIDISEIADIKNDLKISIVYILDELKDNGSAIKLKLIPGKLCE